MVKFLNKFLGSRLCDREHPDLKWGTLLLTQVADIPSHRDYRNEWGTKNCIICVPGRTELWIQTFQGPRKGELPPQPDWLSGSVRELHRGVEVFDPRDHHAVRKNPRLVPGRVYTLRDS